MFLTGAFLSVPFTVVYSFFPRVEKRLWYSGMLQMEFSRDWMQKRITRSGWQHQQKIKKGRSLLWPLYKHVSSPVQISVGWEGSYGVNQAYTCALSQFRAFLIVTISTSIIHEDISLSHDANRSRVWTLYLVVCDHSEKPCGCFDFFPRGVRGSSARNAYSKMKTIFI